MSSASDPQPTGKTLPAIILGICFIAGLAIAGSQLANGIVSFQTLNRSVTVKGLAEKEVPANIDIWPKVS